MNCIHQTKRELVIDLVTVIFVVGIAAVALKWATFFGQWVLFPYFPNALDATFLIAGAVWLGARSLYRRVK